MKRTNNQQRIAAARKLLSHLSFGRAVEQQPRAALNAFRLGSRAAALIFESGPGEIAVEPCSGACREAIELYFSTPPERWRAPLTR